MHLPDDIEFPPAICMECNKECTRSEAVHTGDDNAYKGWEMWGFCPECNVETFHHAIQII